MLYLYTPSGSGDGNWNSNLLPKLLPFYEVYDQAIKSQKLDISFPFLCGSSNVKIACFTKEANAFKKVSAKPFNWYDKQFFLNSCYITLLKGDLRNVDVIYFIVNTHFTYNVKWKLGNINICMFLANEGFLS